MIPVIHRLESQDSACRDSERRVTKGRGQERPPGNGRKLLRHDQSGRRTKSARIERSESDGRAAGEKREAERKQSRTHFSERPAEPESSDEGTAKGSLDGVKPGRASDRELAGGQTLTGTRAGPSSSQQWRDGNPDRAPSEAARPSDEPDREPTGVARPRPEPTTPVESHSFTGMAIERDSGGWRQRQPPF